MNAVKRTLAVIAVVVMAVSSCTVANSAPKDCHGNATCPSTTTPAAPTTTVSPGSPVPVGPARGSRLLVFDDEFSGTALDRSKWTDCEWPPGCGYVGGVQISPANTTVGGGYAVLTLSDSATGAYIVSKGASSNSPVPGYEFRAAIVEARIWFPGNGFACYNWPAWWSSGFSWPADGENDIAEVLNGPMTVNYHSRSGAHNQGPVPGYWCGGFHTYTLNRQATRSDVYYDGVLVKTYATDDHSRLEHLIISVGQGDLFQAYGAASQVKVDYVRAWQ